MPALTVADVQAKEEAIAQALADFLPSGKWGRNDALRHLAARALSYVLTLLDKDQEELLKRYTRDGLLARDLFNDQDAIDAATLFLNGLGIAPGVGSFAQGDVVFYTTRFGNVGVPADLSVVIGNETFTNSYVEDHVVSSEDLVAIRDARGVIAGYSFVVPVVANEAGEDGNVDTGPVTSFDQFDPFVYAGQVLRKFSGGTIGTTQTEILTNLEDYIGADILDNAQNITRYIRLQAPFVETLDVIYAGHVLMARDRVFEGNPALQFHAGGMTDVFITTPIVEEILFQDLEVGGIFDLAASTILRPVNATWFFRDAETDFVAAGVAAGDILFLRTGWTGTQTQYEIQRVWDNYLMVRVETPFPAELDSLEYSIGRRGDTYQDVLPGVGSSSYSTTGETTSELQVPGAVFLTGVPFTYFTEVSFQDATSDLADPTTGRVYFQRRVNAAPADPTTVETLEYRIDRLNPKSAQSQDSPALLYVGDYTEFAGRALLLKGAVPQGFASVASLLPNINSGSGRATVHGKTLVRQKHPAQVSMTCRYKAAPNTTVDETALKTFLANSMTQATDNETFGLDDLVELARAEFTDLRSLYIDTARTTVDMPDGTVLQYADFVYDFDAATPVVRFVGDVIPADAGIPSEQGVGRPTVQFYSSADLITLEEIT